MWSAFGSALFGLDTPVSVKRYQQIGPRFPNLFQHTFKIENEASRHDAVHRNQRWIVHRPNLDTGRNKPDECQKTNDELQNMVCVCLKLPVTGNSHQR